MPGTGLDGLGARGCEAKIVELPAVGHSQRHRCILGRQRTKGEGPVHRKPVADAFGGRYGLGLELALLTVQHRHLAPVKARGSFRAIAALVVKLFRPQAGGNHRPLARALDHAGSHHRVNALALGVRRERVAFAVVLEALDKQGLEPAAEADRATLVRRVSLDLRGLPPTLEEVDAFLADRDPGAYERMVDRMLASPHYGEKMALIWMDLARHGDTSGYHFDSTRDTWPWRDWVIEAYNDNMPFDHFSIEQLGGDLLPGAGDAQKIASGFNRNSRFNEEGGADPDEWLVRYAVDRTTTLGRVWLGLTLNCAPR
ncbi:DUF1549 domain-containing protein [bacterium]|nr:DUF1549 domain-containing protein [bacterium]